MRHFARPPLGHTRHFARPSRSRSDTPAHCTGMAAAAADGGLLLAPADLAEGDAYAGSVRVDIVGVQHYRGIISNREGVRF